MGRELHPVDFESVLSDNNKVRQLFYAEENGVHYVNLKLKTRITRTRAVSALRELEGITINMFELPSDARTWNSVIYTFSELSNEGAFIRRIILQHKNDGRADFYQYLAPRIRHPTIMLGNTAVSDHTALPNTAPPVVGVVSRSSSVVTEIYTPAQIPVIHGVRLIPETLPDGSRNSVLDGLIFTREFFDHMDRFYNIPYGTDVQDTLDNIHTRMSDMDSRIVVIERIVGELREIFRH
jgi:hypothetical protein